MIPLNEECGLLEWVNNTSGLRHILIKLYKEKGVYMSGAELKAAMPPLSATKEYVDISYCPSVLYMYGYSQTNVVQHAASMLVELMLAIISTRVLCAEVHQCYI